MNNRIALVFTLAAAMIGLSPPQAGADMKDVFLPEMDRAVEQAVQAWTVKDAKGMQEAMERLVLNETYLLAVGRSDAQRSYLVRLPRELADNLNATAAYLFLLQCERRGQPLWPKTLFCGKVFITQIKGGKQ